MAKKELVTAKEPVKKRAVGRPTKYDVSLIDKVYAFIEQKQQENIPPFVERLAYVLGIDTDTIVDWCKKHKKFSVAIKKMKEVQCAMLQEGIYSDGKTHGTGGIFLLKNNHGFKDRTETDVTSGGKPIPILGGISVKDVHRNDSDKENSEAPQKD